MFWLRANILIPLVIIIIITAIALEKVKGRVTVAFAVVTAHSLIAFNLRHGGYPAFDKNRPTSHGIGNGNECQKNLPYCTPVYDNASSDLFPPDIGLLLLLLLLRLILLKVDGGFDPHTAVNVTAKIKEYNIFITFEEKKKSNSKFQVHRAFLDQLTD